MPSIRLLGNIIFRDCGNDMIATMKTLEEKSIVNLTKAWEFPLANETCDAMGLKHEFINVEQENGKQDFLAEIAIFDRRHWKILFVLYLSHDWSLKKIIYAYMHSISAEWLKILNF